MYKVETIYTPGLAQNAYVVIAENEAIVIDPRRDTHEIHAILKDNNAKLKYIFETHSHADFLSGGPQLSNETGAPLMISDIVSPNVPHTSIRHADTFAFGNAKVTALHTPGHTPEHMCYFVESENQNAALFSGDLIFVGDLGRPELLGDDLAKDLAPKLFDSVFGTISMLPPQTVVYPGHGAGSLCGKSLRDAPTTTLADEFATSPALQIKNKQDFIDYMMSGQPRVPGNFTRMAKLNRAGVPLLSERKLEELSVEQIEQELNSPDSLVLDIRDEKDYAAAHIPNSIFLGLGNSVPTWLGWLFTPEQTISLVASEKSKAEEFVKIISRVGYDNVKGVLIDGVNKWAQSGRKTASLSLTMPASVPAAECLIDVRTPNEFQHDHISNSKSIPLCEIPNRSSELPRDKKVTLMCGSGYRSAIAGSILLKQGFTNIENVDGGFEALQKVAT